MEKIIEIEAGKFVIRPYCDQDEDSVRKLWKAAFGKEMPNLLWQWKYLKNPYNRQMMLCLNQNGDAAVVSFTGIPYRANMNGKAVEMTQVMDVMSHPDYRKTGLFIKTVQSFFEFFGKDILFVYGFPGKYHLDIGEKYLGYTALTKKVSYLSVQTDVFADKKAESGRIERITKVDASFDRLWEQCQKEYSLSVIRNSDFVRWRFLNHPMKQYDIFGYQKDSELNAYAVFAMKDKKARLVDILAPPAESLISDFISQTALILRNSGAEQIETWLPENHFITESLISTGFVNLPEPLGITSTVRNFENSPPSDWTSENLFYTMADADLF